MPELWHTLAPEKILTVLQSDKTQGLTDQDVQERRKQHGWNELPQKKRSLLLMFLEQFHDVMIYILLAALVFSIVGPLLEEGTVSLDSFLDAFVIAAILILNAVLGFVQEFKAEEAIAVLQKLHAPQVHVRRNGKECILPSRELVPGDIVIFEAGERIAADGRLLVVSHVQINESSLTGESLPVEKTTDSMPKDCVLAERKDMIFAGTLVTRGYGEYVVTSTGLHTEIGNIAKLVSQTAIPETPLQKRMKHLGLLLGGVVIALSLIVVGVGVWTGGSIFEMFLVGVTLAVSAVPEGLPAVVTVCMAIGVRRMVKKNALVRKLDALETLGSVTIICADKTGTMTENIMKVIDTYVVSDTPEEHALLARIGASCNRAKLPNLGDPTEIGLLEFAKKENIERLPIDDEEVPFSSEKKYMQTRHGDVIYLKGAPETIVELCDGEVADTMLEHSMQMAQKGLRVLAFAVRADGKTRIVGLMGMEDPPREGIQKSIAEALCAGIRTVMITGDHIDTARSIARQTGLSGEAIEGKDIDAMTDEELLKKLRTVAVIARVSPVHKIRILQILQKDGHVVAMSGDGVNDAPALKGAHVGVAMGKKGTQVAREASSIVLADDHYATIVSAIREGRRIYDNIRKFVIYLLRSNFDELLFIMTTLMIGLPLPYLPLHILWINLMTDSLPALALGIEGEEPDIMKRPPRSPTEHLLHGEWIYLILATLWSFAVAFLLFWYLVTQGLPIEEVRSMVLTVAVFFELGMALVSRSKRPLWQIGIFTNRWLLGAIAIPSMFHLALLYTPLNALFHLVPLSLHDWFFVLPIAVSGLLLFEFVKTMGFFWRRYKKGEAACVYPL